MGRETFSITIDRKEIWFRDRKWGNRKVLPLTEKEEKDLKKLGLEVWDDEESKEKYMKAESDEELAEIIIEDTKKQGGRLLQRWG